MSFLKQLALALVQFLLQRKSSDSSPPPSEK